MELRRNAFSTTEREAQILELLAEGKSNSEIGDCLFISVHTVKANLEKLYEKFGVHNRVQLVIKAVQLKIINLDKATT